MPPEEKQCSDGDSTRTKRMPGGLLHVCRRDVSSPSAVGLLFLEGREQRPEGQLPGRVANG